MYTPNDGDNWMLAKLNVQVTDVGYAQFVEHLGRVCIHSGAITATKFGEGCPTFSGLYGESNSLNASLLSLMEYFLQPSLFRKSSFFVSHVVLYFFAE